MVTLKDGSKPIVTLPESGACNGGYVPNGGTISCTYGFNPGYDSPFFNVYTQAYATCSKTSNDAAAANLADGEGPSVNSMASMDSEPVPEASDDSGASSASPSPAPASNDSGAPASPAPTQDQAQDFFDEQAKKMLSGGRKLLRL